MKTGNHFIFLEKPWQLINNKEKRHLESHDCLCSKGGHGFEKLKAQVRAVYI